MKHMRQELAAMLHNDLKATSRDLGVVVGDVDSTLAAALACCDVGTPVMHIEAGLRSFDETMPEEINRVETDRLSQYCVTHCQDADENLAQAKRSHGHVRRLGNLLIDCFEAFRPQMQQRHAAHLLGLSESFELATIHRQGNLTADRLHAIVSGLQERAKRRCVAISIHHSLARAVEDHGIDLGGLVCIPPQRYVDCGSLLLACELLITDSGGLQEETAHIGKPCLTVRPNTERPITLRRGNRLVEPAELATATPAPTLDEHSPWDGKAAGRVANWIVDIMEAAS
jgi:UDP-N-acetylglucosamine 2-epimerase (non-hydrolysing)